MNLKNLLPIRKVAVGAIAWGVYLVAQKADLGTITPEVSNEVAQGVVTFAAMYLLPDPRVQKIGGAARVTLLAKLKALNALLNQAAAGPQESAPTDPEPTPLRPVA